MTTEDGDGGGGKDFYDRLLSNDSDDEDGREKGDGVAKTNASDSKTNEEVTDKDKLERPTNGERVSQRSWPR